MSKQSAKEAYERNRARILAKKRESYRLQKERRDKPDGRLEKLTRLPLPLDQQQKPKPYIPHVLYALM